MGCCCFGVEGGEERFVAIADMTIVLVGDDDDDDDDDECKSIELTVKRQSNCQSKSFCQGPILTTKNENN
jgi:hypothetical protein